MKSIWLWFKEHADGIFKLLGGVMASVAIITPSLMMVMDRAEEARHKLSLQETEQAQTSQAQHLQAAQQDQLQREEQLVAEQLALSFWLPHRASCQQAATTAVTLATQRALNPTTLQAWTLHLHSTLPAIPSPPLQAAGQVFQDALSCQYACTVEQLLPPARAIAEQCACLGCDQLPDLCGRTCTQ